MCKGMFENVYDAALLFKFSCAALFNLFVLSVAVNTAVNSFASIIKSFNNSPDNNSASLITVNQYKDSSASPIRLQLYV